MKDNKYIIPSLITIGIIMVVIGSTFAYWNWQSTNAQKTAVSFTVGSTFSCSADGGGNITANNYFAPTDCDNSTYAVKREVVVNTTSQVTNEIINLSMDLNISNISPALLQSDNFKYALSKNANSCSGAISGGSFKDNYDSDSHTVPLLIDEEFIGTESKTYYLYIWLDKEETNSNTMNTSFSASLEGSCTDSGNVLKKVYAYFGGPVEYFKDAAYRDNITSVSFVNEINIPENATNWNVGYSPSNASDVKAWLEDDGSGNNTFDLKIGANGTIFASSLGSAFSNMSNISNFAFNDLNTSETTNMVAMFEGVGSNVTDFYLDLGNYFDTSNVTEMTYMFSNAGRNSTNFSIDLGNKFDTSSVIRMPFMFDYSGSNATNWILNLGNKFNTSNVTTMASMFRFAGANSNNFNLNLGNGFNTTNITNMQSMFSSIGANSENFTINLGNKFDTSNVTNMAWMFSEVGRYASNLSLALGNKFNTSNVTNMYHMFSYVGRTATNMQFSLGNNFDTSNVTNMQMMFSYYGAEIENWTLNLGDKFDTSNVINLCGLFYGAGKNATTWDLNLGYHFNTSNVIDMSQLFSSAGVNATTISLNLGYQFYTTNVENISWAFFNFGRNVQENFILDLSIADFSNVTNSSVMFTGFPTSKATIYVKDTTAQNFILAQNNGFSASNVLIK